VLRVCHALHDAEQLDSEAFLEDKAQFEARRDMLHLKVVHPNGELTNLYILRGECTHVEQEATRKRLAPSESMWQGWWLQPPLGVVPQGKFPSHTTGAGEGYGWSHISAYMQYAHTALSTSNCWCLEESDIGCACAVLIVVLHRMGMTVKPEAQLVLIIDHVHLPLMAVALQHTL